MKKIILAILLLAIPCIVTAQTISVTLTTDEGYARPVAISKAEANLSKVLSEINKAYNEKRVLNIVGLPMNDFAIDALTMLWEVAHFYVDDTEVVDRIWVFEGNGFMEVQHVPIIITPENGSSSGTFQGAVIEFDLNGKITDFRFALDAQVRESMTNCGNGVVDKERSMLILQYIERFRTAYNTKDINFLQDIFSDDALIITGKVVTRKSFQDATIKISPQVTYKKQNKTQYINNLRRAFARNQWIDVKFEQIANGGSTGCGGITRSDKNPNLYGVRLRQEWKSSTYSDEGYVFLLWNFADPDKPEITVRTWQPEFLDAAKTQRLPEEEIFSLSTVGDF